MASGIDEVRVERMSDKGATSEPDDGSDDSQLASLYRRYAGRVYTLCLWLLANVRAADDATVQVFVRFNRELARLWDESYVQTRLRYLSIDEALSRLHVRGQKAAQAAIPLSGYSHSNTTAPLDRVSLDRLVSRLTDPLRVAFVLHDREGLTKGAIAAHLQINEADVRRLVHSARLELVRLRLMDKTSGTKEEKNG
jgi:RNA polymerase sigma-70 factor (ECF subfamily)